MMRWSGDHRIQGIPLAIRLTPLQHVHPPLDRKTVGKCLSPRRRYDEMGECS